MKISEFIKNLEWQIETYGDAELRICWDRHEQLKYEDVFFSRVIGGHENIDKLVTEELNKELTNDEGLWIQNFPY